MINNNASLAFGSTITVNQPNALYFIANSAEKGGGVYIELNTRILMKKYYGEQIMILQN